MWLDKRASAAPALRILIQSYIFKKHNILLFLDHHRLCPCRNTRSSTAASQCECGRAALETASAARYLPKPPKLLPEHTLPATRVYNNLWTYY